MTKVGIIGAGPAGLVAAKSALEAGLTPIVFEAAPVVGGLWKGEKTSLAWQGMRTNLSKWSCMFSDYPWPDTQTDIFPTQAEVCGYLDSYTKHFNLSPYIQVETQVNKAEPSPKGWEITTTRQGQQTRQHADKLIVASGFFSEGKIPAIAQVENFHGQIIHSSHFYDPDLYQGKKVAVVGGSFSGCEISAALTKSGIEVTHILRDPFWIASRLTPDKNIPLDVLFYNRQPENSTLTTYEKNRLSAEFLERTYGNPGDAHPDLSIDSQSGSFNFVAVSDDYLRLVSDGLIQIQRAELQNYTDTGLQLANGKHVEADTVIYATGFRSKLDFLSDDLREKLNFKEDDGFMPLPLHLATLPATDENLGFVGFYRGPYFGTMELQARWLAAIMGGAVAAPQAAERLKGVEDALTLRRQMPRPQFPYGDYIALSDTFARALGVMPEIADQGGFVVPSRYRLRGMFAKPDMARTILASLPVPGEPT